MEGAPRPGGDVGAELVTQLCDRVDEGRRQDRVPILDRGRRDVIPEGIVGLLDEAADGLEPLRPAVRPRILDQVVVEGASEDGSPRGVPHGAAGAASEVLEVPAHQLAQCHRLYLGGVG